MSWYIRALKNILNFQDRARRKEYWYFTLFYIIFSAILLWLVLPDFSSDNWEEQLESSFDNIFTTIILNIFGWSHFIAALSVTVRRLHDSDRSAFWLLVSFVPLVGALTLFILMLFPGTPGDNRYGPDPLDDGFEDDYADEYSDRAYSPASHRRASSQPRTEQSNEPRGYIDPHAPISNEGMEYKDRFSTLQEDENSIYERFGLISAAEETPEPESSALEFDTAGLELAPEPRQTRPSLAPHAQPTKFQSQSSQAAVPPQRRTAQRPVSVQTPPRTATTREQLPRREAPPTRGAQQEPVPSIHRRQPPVQKGMDSTTTGARPTSPSKAPLFDRYSNPLRHPKTGQATPPSTRRPSK